jgi:hypothetical protein
MGQIVALFIVAIVLCFAAGLTATLVAASIGLWLDLLDQLAERRRRKAQPSRRPSFAELLMPPPRDQDPDWRHSFSHENTKRPSGPPPLRLRRSEPPELFIRMDEAPVQRGNRSGGPTTPKPEITPKPVPTSGRNPFVREFQQQINDALGLDGYQPRPQQGTPNPPPREP